MFLSCVFKTCLLIKYCRTNSISRLGKTVLFRNSLTTMPITCITMKFRDIGNPKFKYYLSPSIKYESTSGHVIRLKFSLCSTIRLF